MIEPLSDFEKLHNRAHGVGCDCPASLLRSHPALRQFQEPENQPTPTLHKRKLTRKVASLDEYRLKRISVR